MWTAADREVDIAIRRTLIYQDHFSSDNMASMSPVKYIADAFGHLNYDLSAIHFHTTTMPSLSIAFPSRCATSIGQFLYIETGRVLLRHFCSKACYTGEGCGMELILISKYG